MSPTTALQHMDGFITNRFEEDFACRSLHSDVRPEFLVHLSPYSTHLRWRPLLALWVQAADTQLHISLGDVPPEEELVSQEEAFMMRKREVHLR